MKLWYSVQRAGERIVTFIVYCLALYGVLWVIGKIGGWR